MPERACRICRTVTNESVCPNCDSKDLSRDFVGIVSIFDGDGSQIARKMGIKKSGRYAIRVR
ncbi:MAG: transcription elongation factor subunit Spt4 [Candidatus Bathyarchaeia archaeon]